MDGHPASNADYPNKKSLFQVEYVVSPSKPHISLKGFSNGYYIRIRRL